jgi:hypothetical protein
LGNWKVCFIIGGVALFATFSCRFSDLNRCIIARGLDPDEIQEVRRI